MIAVDRIDTREALETLRPEWSALWDRCKSPTPFQTPEWLIPWWDSFGSGSLAVLSLRSGGRLVGLAPFRIAGGVLGLLGAGISDYLDILVEPGCRAAAAEALWLHVRTLPLRSLEFTDVPAGSALLDSPPAGASVSECAFCPVLALPAPQRRGVRRYSRYVSPLENASYQTLDEFLDALFRLHSARWNERGEPGVLGDSALQAFHRHAAAGLLASGRLLLAGVRRSGSLAAVVYGFQGHERIWTYLSGIDPAAARLSPGTVALGLVLEQAARAGCCEADLLRGKESYKYAWGARDRPTFRLESRLPW
jgi:CelD/BcsL family acetyltransferase involved in cellulose biosynthesis